MVELYDLVGDIFIWEQETIDHIIELYDTEDWNAINTLYNKDDDFETADGIMMSLYGIESVELNHMADNFGYSRV